MAVRLEALPVERHQLARDPARYRAVSEAAGLHILSYHDVHLDEEALRRSGDRLGVTVNQLARHFTLLRDLGYTVVSFQQVEAALRGEGRLPPRAVLLTFDDGYQSFHRHVVPLLRAFGYPAVLAIVGQWTERTQAGDRGTMVYPQTPEFRPDVRAPLMNWEELADVLASGFVTLASHTFDLHTLHPITPQGDRAPAATTRRWLAEQARRETDQEWRTRVSADLARNQQLLEQRLGVKPRAVVWPYGAENEALRQIALSLGAPFSLALDGQSNDLSRTAPKFPVRLSRHLISATTDLSTLEAKFLPREIPHRRVVGMEFSTPRQISDFIADEAGRFGPFLDQLRKLSPSHVRFRLTPGFFSADSNTERNPGLAAAIRLLHRTRLATGVRIEVDVSDALEAQSGAMRPVVFEYLRELFASAFADALVVPTGGVGVALHREIQRLFPDLERIERIDVGCEAVAQVQSAQSNPSANPYSAGEFFEIKWTSVIERGGYALLRVREDETQACLKQLASVLPELANRLPDRFERTQIEFLPMTEDLDAAMNWLGRSAHTLYAAGFRHFALGRWHAGRLSGASERALESVFSLRREPLLR
ncbi:MAG: polysaccharide deacetylase family protein [Casimicrobiaceae bacterium]